MTPRVEPPATPTLRVPIGVRWGPALLAAIGSMLAPLAVSLALAPRPPTLPWLAVPIGLGALLPLPVTALVLVTAARGEVVVADGALRWAVDGRAGRIDLGAPFTAEAWVEAPSGDDTARVVLRADQGGETVTLAYPIAADQAPALPRRAAAGPAHLVVAWRPRRAWEALWAALQAAPGRREGPREGAG